MSSLYTALEVTGATLTAQRRRLELLVGNIANAQTTRTKEGGPFRRKDVVFVNKPNQSFADMLWESNGELGTLEGVEIDRVVTDNSPPIMRYEPGHPDADAAGYVAYPNINPLDEMANLLNTTRSFEANVRAFQAVKEIIKQSIEIGRNG